MTQKKWGIRLFSFLLLAVFAVGLVQIATTPPVYAARPHRASHTARSGKSVRVKKASRKPEKRHHTPRTVTARSKTRDRDHIAAFVATIQPKKGSGYARRVAKAIRRSAKATGVSPDVLLATGYVESELRMISGPCVGMMQVHPRTLREMRRRLPAARGLNPQRVEDNIQLGALELASYYRNGTKKTGQKASLRHALGRYNGAGANSGYVRRVQTVLRRIRSGDTVAWQRHLQQHGPLWRA